MNRIPNTSWFINGKTAIKLCDKTVLKEASTVLPMDTIKDFFYNKELEPGNSIPLNIKFRNQICKIEVKKYNAKSQEKQSTNLNWKGSNIDIYLNKLENMKIYDFKNSKGDTNIKDYTRMEFSKEVDGTISLEIVNKSNHKQFIFRKIVDKSTLNEGITIPQEYHQKFLGCIPNKYIERGNSEKVKLIFDDYECIATLRNVNRAVKSDTIQLMYNKEVSEYFKNKFSHSFSMSDENGKISNSDESIDFYLTEEENTYIVKLNTEGSDEINMEDYFKVVENINKYMASSGYSHSINQLSNFYLSLKTKPFIIIAGISGTGKSKIVRLFGEAIGATPENKQMNMISVRPDWNDSSDLIGYKNLKDQFIEGQLTKVILEASKPENKTKPYFICLDEMNLARVEYYLSDYLSIIESRRKNGQEIITDSIIEDPNLQNGKITIPDNLYLIGTVNMDDTTFQFSRKVLDRANTIEFSEVDLENLFPQTIEEDIEPLKIDNSFLKTNYLKTTDIEEEHRDYAKTVNQEIIKINEILKKSQKQFAYRVRDEILFYMVENKKSELLEEDLAFDYQIMQKILPTVTGSESSVADVLIDLFNYVCDKKVIDTVDRISIEEAQKHITNNNIRYTNSAQKILFMLKGYNNDGYVSYWY